MSPSLAARSFSSATSLLCKPASEPSSATCWFALAFICSAELSSSPWRLSALARSLARAFCSSRCAMSALVDTLASRHSWTCCSEFSRPARAPSSLCCSSTCKPSALPATVDLSSSCCASNAPMQAARCCSRLSRSEASALVASAAQSACSRSSSAAVRSCRAATCRPHSSVAAPRRSAATAPTCSSWVLNVAESTLSWRTVWIFPSSLLWFSMESSWSLSAVFIFSPLKRIAIPRGQLGMARTGGMKQC
mmetsp:Transcript_3684/g.10121  ORF Transcript_3684/g.10121 Transcript_3684/m.10121 type:complete len:250 (-) Transcript_3684:10-759(-)